MSIKLSYKILNEQQEAVAFPDEKEIIIGRPKDNKIPTIDFTPDLRVSREHCRIYYDIVWWIEDMGSKNKTIINKKEIFTATQLKPGDIIVIGDSTIKIEEAVTDCYDELGESKHEQTIDEAVSPKAVLTDDQFKIVQKIADIIGFSKHEISKRERFLDVLKEAFPKANRIGILLNKGKEFEPVESYPYEENPHFSSTLAGWAKMHKTARHWVRTMSDLKSKGIESLKGTFATIYSPMVCENKVSGVIHVDSTCLDTAFNEKDVTLLNVFSNLIANTFCIEKIVIEEKIKILFISANPLNTPRLRIDKEIESVINILQEQKLFDLEVHFAVTTDKIDDIFLHCTPKPHIVYFSGHVTEQGSVKLDNREIPLELFVKLFKFLDQKTQCVLLNACYSKKIADVLKSEVKSVIGMSGKITDEGAIYFARGFFSGLKHGCSIKKAFELGCLKIELNYSKYDVSNVPQLIVKDDIDPAYIRFGEKHTDTAQV